MIVRYTGSSTAIATSYTDTVASDTFTASTGTLSATDVDANTTLTYGIANITVNNGVATKVGTYGTLAVTAATGAYTFTPNAAAINALVANTTETFTVTVSDGTATTSTSYTVNLTGVNDAPTITAAAFKLLYETTTPSRNSSGAIIYSAGYGIGGSDAAALLAASGAAISRVRYRMELTVAGSAKYAEATFDAWAGLAPADLRVPADDSSANRFVVQRNVANLTVDSNYGTVTNGVGLAGRLELWPYNYSPSVSGLVPAGNGGTYDFDDIPSVNTNGHGSFQVHNTTNAQTVLAWNMHRNSGPPEIGFGNQPSGQPDWTSSSSLGSTGWKLQVWVETAAGATSTLPTIAEDVADGSNSGALVSALVTNFTDADSGAVKGLAVTRWMRRTARGIIPRMRVGRGRR